MRESAAKPRKYEVIVHECCSCTYCVTLNGRYDICRHPKRPLNALFHCTRERGDIRYDCPLEFADEEAEQ